MSVDDQLLGALDTLWRIPPLEPDYLLSSPAFVALSELIAQRTDSGKATFVSSHGHATLTHDASAGIADPGLRVPRTCKLRVCGWRGMVLQFPSPCRSVLTV